MPDEKLIQEAKQEFFKNDYWRKWYQNAPSQECKRYCQYKFYFSNGGQYIQEWRDQVQNALSIQDWKYILKTNGNNPHVLYIKKKIAELQGEA